MTWLNDIFRSLFFFLDKIIYSLIGTVYNLFTDIAETTIFTNEIIDLFSSRIYALLGVFMLFKVSFSILSYIVNPDEFVDKNKGFSKIISNVVITLVLLVATPWIFNRAMDIQKIILRENVIGKIFSTTEISNNISVDPGNLMSYQVLKGFYHLDTVSFPDCEGLEEESIPTDFEGLEEESITTDFESGKYSACASTAFNNSQSFGNYADTLRFAYHINSVDVYMSADLVNQKSSEGTYTMSYMPLISTVCGVVIVLILITFCFDVAVRSIKLGFLRVLAPIPIASRIIPKKGEDVFNKWLKMCINTYLNLFIRLLAIYFALFVIMQVTNLDIVDAVTGTPVEVNVFVKIFITLGALLFAKQLPKLIEDLTGVKMDGKFTMNPMNKIRQVPLVGAGVTAGSAMLGGAITGGIAGAQAGHTFRGAWQGMMGAKSSMKGKVPLMGDDKGKSPHALRNGMHAGYKTIKGKDYEIWSPWKQLGKSSGEDEIDRIKKSKYDLQGAQATLDAELQNYYRQYENMSNELNAALARKDSVAANFAREKLASLQSEIEANRSKYGKYSKYISVIDDQIRDVKKLYYIDDSPKEDLSEALSAAESLRKNSSSSTVTSSSATTDSSTHGPNGKGDPVPGQPNPNTSKKKQKRKNN